MINTVLNLLQQASDEDLMLSRKNCHIKGLHSIVLYKDKFDRLLRLYLTDRKHQMGNNMKDNLVINLGVHNHRYDLQLTSVHGKALNITYRITDNRSSNLRADCYKFYDKDTFEKQDRVFLKKGKVTLIDNIFMDKNTPHTVYVPYGNTASWLVQEGFEMRDHTMLYTNSDLKCKEYSLFNSADEVRKFVIDYYEGLK